MSGQFDQDNETNSDAVTTSTTWKSLNTQNELAGQKGRIGKSCPSACSSGDGYAGRGWHVCHGGGAGCGDRPTRRGVLSTPLPRRIAYNRDRPFLRCHRILRPSPNVPPVLFPPSDPTAMESLEGTDHAGGDEQRPAPGSSELRKIAADLPRAAVGRLSLYFRELHRLSLSGVTSVNSRELGRLVDVSPAVVRRDLSTLGSNGRRGVGYSVGFLTERIGELLGSGVSWKVILVGVGSLGDALLRYRGFEQLGFRLAAAFDVDPKKIGTRIGGVRIDDYAVLSGVCASIQPDLGILAVPVEAAPDVAANLASIGVTGILNFTPMTIKLPRSIAVINVDLASELQRLAFTVHAKR